MTTKVGEIMWVYPDIVKDEHWESSKPNLKGRSCNVVSLVNNDDAMTVPSLSDSEIALAAQPTSSKLIGTQSCK